MKLVITLSLLIVIILGLIVFISPLKTYITSLVGLGDVIHPYSTVITDVGIATPKIGEVRIVDPGNASDIQGKIDSCPSNGCRVFIPVGNYTINDTIVINSSRSNIILTGAVPGHIDYDYLSGGTVFMQGANKFNIINITGNSTNKVYNILIENIYFNAFEGYAAQPGRAIYAENTSDLKTINNFFAGFTDSAIALKNTQGFLADHNNFWFCSSNASQTFCIEFLNAPPNNNSYANIIYNEFELSSGNYGSISTEYTNSSYIAGNILEGVPYGIRTGSGARVTGNYFYQPTRRAIISDHSDVIIEGNSIGMPAGSNRVAIYTSGGTIVGNFLKMGILVNGSQARIIGNHISLFVNSSGITGGIVLMNSNYSIVSNNIVKGGGASTGIVIKDNSNNNIITGNTVLNYDTGINESISGDGNNTITDNNVIANTNIMVITGSNTKVYKNMGYTT